MKLSSAGELYDPRRESFEVGFERECFESVGRVLSGETTGD